MKPPNDLTPRGRGRKFWRKITDKYDLTAGELEILSEVCRTLDEIEDLRAEVVADGPTTTGSKLQTVVHPGLQELRQQRAELRRLLASLDLPDPEQATGKAVRSARSERAARAARTRWKVHDGAT